MEEKLCSLDEWRSFYRKDQARRLLINDIFSRIRGATNETVFIIKRGAWAKSHIFSRCQDCGRVSFYGVCHNCGYMTVCCVCQRVEMPDGSWRKIKLLSDNMTHSICLECTRKEYPDFYFKLPIRRES